METKYSFVLKRLLEDIRGGKYRNAEFPSENMSARRFSVGRKTITRAYDELVRRGLISRRRGAGTVLTHKADREYGRIGLIVHGSDYCELFAPIARRISHLCQKNGLALLFADLSGDAVSRRIGRVAAAAEEFVKTGVNGVIFQPVELVKNAEAINRKILSTFDAADVPVVLLDSDIVRSPERSRYDLAAVNHVEAGRRIGEHLVRCGAKRIAYLMEREHAPCVQDRYLGVKVGADGKMAKGSAVYAKPDDLAAIRKALKALRPDAFACYNDREARILISTLARLGYAVPKDIQVAGFDDVNYATIAEPALTTVHQPCGELADLAFEMLKTRIEMADTPIRETFLNAPLVVRETTRHDISPTNRQPPRERKPKMKTNPQPTNERKSKMKTLIGAVCCLATVLCQAADGTLTVSGTVNWSDTKNWKDGIVAGDGGNATINGSGTVNVDAPISLKGLGVTIQNGTELTIAGSKITLAAASGDSTIRVDEGQLYLRAPVEYNSDLLLFGSGKLFPCTPMTSPSRNRIYLRDAQLSLDFSRTDGIVENLLPNAPLLVNGYYSSLLRMGGKDTSHKQEFSSYDLNAPFTVGGSGTLKSSNVRGVNGSGALTVGQHDYDTVVFQAADLFSRYFSTTTVRGQARIRLQPLPAAATTLPVKSGCTFHVDASATATMTTELRNGETVVTRWADASGGSNAAVAPIGAQAAVLRANALNGLPVVDFGPATGNGGMDWVNSLSDIRDVFIVIGSQRGGGTLLGTKQSENNYLYERGRNMHVTKGAGQTGGYTLPLIRDTSLFYNSPGTVYLNGDSELDGVNTLITGLSGEYDLVELVGNQNGTASAFARRAGLTDSQRDGREAGQALAEVVIYNRTLQDAERRQVEAYLMKKWFGRDRRGFGPAAVENVTIAPPANWHNYGLLQNTTAESPVVAKRMAITGDGTSYYTVASADNIVAERAEIGRKLRLMGGKFTLTARQTAATLPGPRPAFHVDATTGVETDGSGVSKWTDASGGTVYAVPEDNFKPTLVANGLNGKPVVDFGSASSCQHLRWSSNIVVRTLFFVMKLTNNKVSFLGSSSTSQMAVVDNFTRYLNNTDFLYNGDGSVEGNLLGGLCYLDGIRIANPKLQKFNGFGGFRALAHVLEGGLMANAFGCGAYQTSNHRAERTGGLQIAEAIVYDRRLTEDECLDVQAYLRWKWFGETLAGYAQPGEPYTICAAGSGAAGSVLTVRGTAPATISELFGGADLKLSAPETTVSIPAVQGTLTLSNACVSARSDLAAGKLLFCPGTTNALAPGEGTIAAFTVKGVLDARNGSSQKVTSLTFEPNTGLLLGTASMNAGALTLGDGVGIVAGVTSDGKSGVVNAGNLSVAGTGVITLENVGDRENPTGRYAIMTFKSLTAADAARLNNWTIEVPGLSAKFRPKVTVANNTVYVSVARPGLFMLVK